MFELEICSREGESSQLLKNVVKNSNKQLKAVCSWTSDGYDVVENRDLSTPAPQLRSPIGPKLKHQFLSTHHSRERHANCIPHTILIIFVSLPPTIEARMSSCPDLARRPCKSRLTLRLYRCRHSGTLSGYRDTPYPFEGSN